MAMRVELNTLLCAIDFSSFSGQVIRYGIDLCRQINARMIVFHAVPLGNDPFQGGGVLQTDKSLRALSAQALEKIENLMAGAPLPYKPLIGFGDPVTEAEKVAAMEKADLVVTASRGISGIKRMLIGTVVERMARNLSRPLLTLRPVRGGSKRHLQRPFRLQQIVVGCDFRPSSGPAIGYALELARRSGAAMHLLHTIEAPADEDLADSPMTSYAQAQEAQQERDLRRLAALLPDDALASERLKTVLLAGNPAEAVGGYARRVAADLIAVGVQSHGTLDQMLVGSTTETLLRRAPCPVLTVPGDRIAAGKGGV
jgi:nucleotide-binding universal stress UspA family protein